MYLGNERLIDVDTYIYTLKTVSIINELQRKWKNGVVFSKDYTDDDTGKLIINNCGDVVADIDSEDNTVISFYSSLLGKGYRFQYIQDEEEEQDSYIKFTMSAKKDNERNEIIEIVIEKDNWYITYINKEYS